MAVNLSPIGGVAAQFFDNSGNVLSGGKIFTYAAGTTTPQVTYTSSNGATPHPNPIILDAAGRVPTGEIWLTDGLQYKFIIKTSTDVQIGSYDNLVGINSNFVNYTNSQEFQTATAGQTVFTLTTMAYQPGTNSLSVFVDGVNQYGPGASYAYVETSSTVVTFTAGLHVGAEVKFTTSAINASSYGDAEQVSYTPPFTGSVATNVEAKLAQYVSVQDFGAVGDGVTDDTASIQAALTAAKNVVFPGGYTFYVAGTLNVTQNNASVCIEGGTTVYHAGTGTKCFNVTGTNATICGEGTLYSNGAQDATNAPITYAAIWVAAEGCVIRDIRIQRVTRCGVYFSDAGFATVDGVTIDGEFNTSTWVNTDTVLFGVFADPNASPSQGQILVSSCKFARLVSGIGVGNYGSVNDGRGFSFTSNLFVDCADHGVYCASTQGTTVSANTFDRCGAAVALTGDGHVISGNTVTNFDAVRSVYDKVSVNIREPTNCVISNNVLIGPYGASYSGIELSNVSGTNISYNIVDANVVINTGTVQGRMFIIGNGLLTETMTGNVVSNNVFKGPGNNNEAVAAFLMKTTFYGVNNEFSNNIVHSTNQWQCLWLNRQKKMTVHNNKFIWEYTAVSPATYDIVYLNDVSYCTLRSNSMSVIGGANVTIRGITSNASNNNWYTENQSTLTDSSVVAATPIFNAVVSDRVINNTWNINRIEAAAAPTTGTWALGDVVYNTSPTAGGFFGWVCTVAGTPGTWKTFGAISA